MKCFRYTSYKSGGMCRECRTVVPELHLYPGDPVGPTSKAICPACCQACKTVEPFADDAPLPADLAGEQPNLFGGSDV